MAVDVQNKHKPEYRVEIIGKVRAKASKRTMTASIQMKGGFQKYQNKNNLQTLVPECLQGMAGEIKETERSNLKGKIIDIPLHTYLVEGQREIPQEAFTMNALKTLIVCEVVLL